MGYKLFSFFSGIGILDLGFEFNNFEILQVFEKERSFLDAYEFSRQNMNFSLPKYGCSNIEVQNLLNSNEFNSKVKSEKKQSVVGFIGGPPCPDFSVAGKNRGSEGENGRLTKDYFNLIYKEEPHFFLFENVKGSAISGTSYCFWNPKK